MLVVKTPEKNHLLHNQLSCIYLIIDISYNGFIRSTKKLIFNKKYICKCKLKRQIRIPGKDLNK